MRGAAVVREDGTRGTVITDEEHGRIVVEFGDGSRLMISSEALVPLPDGSYKVSAEALPGDQLVIPVIAEELTVETHRVARGRVRIRKRIETREEVVDTPVVSEQVVVERVAVNRVIDGVPPEPHEEDGILIIPLIEEILVVEKRLVVREELRVSRKRITTSSPQKIVLRREVVDIDRQELKGTDSRE